MRTRDFHLTVLTLILLTVLTVAIPAQRKRPVIKPITATVTVNGTDNSPSGRRMTSFEMAWSVLGQNYFDKTFGGLDWNKIRDEYKPRVGAAKTDAEFHIILKEMIARLGKSHLNVIIPEYFEQLESAKKQARVREKQLAVERHTARRDTTPETDDDEQFDDPENARYGIGVELRMLANQIVVTHVDAKSGAEIAGLKPGYVIDKVNGVSLSKLIEAALIRGATAKDIQYFFSLEVIESFLNGQRETSVFLSCLDENDKPKELTVPRLRLDGEAISISKNLPEQFLKYESRLLSPDVGYIKFNAFAYPVVGKFCDSLTGFLDKKALIIDLRGNLGGVIGSMIGLSGMLTDKQVTLGNFRTRAGNEPFTAASKKKHFAGRIVFLVDNESMSASEMFTAGMQANRGAVVVGERTGGKSLPAVWIKLPTGAVMMYPIADFITPKGTSLEGIGLEPDRIVVLDRKSLLLGEDVQLKNALAITGDDTAFAKKLDVAPKEMTVAMSGEPSPPPLMAPPPPRKATPKPIPTTDPGPSDARSIKIIADFAAAVGGTEMVKHIASYEANGRMTAGPNGEVEAEVYAARQFPDKSLFVMNSASIGEIRETHNGTTSFLQSDIGLDRNLFTGADTKRVQLFAPYFDVLDADYLKGIKYQGEYEVDGHMRHVLSATGPRGAAIGLSFDSSTKMLVSYSAPGVLYQLDDYRKIDGVMLPFHVDLDRVMNVRLSSVTVNPKLDPSSFEKKERCFDKAN
ncbi:MAG: S41 family peptidase [Pyrinomonadaceae bacterium]